MRFPCLLWFAVTIVSFQQVFVSARTNSQIQDVFNAVVGGLHAFARVERDRDVTADSQGFLNSEIHARSREPIGPGAPDDAIEGYEWSIWRHEILHMCVFYVGIQPLWVKMLIILVCFCCPLCVCWRPGKLRPDGRTGPLARKNRRITSSAGASLLLYGMGGPGEVELHESPRGGTELQDGTSQGLSLPEGRPPFQGFTRRERSKQVCRRCGCFCCVMIAAVVALVLCKFAILSVYDGLSDDTPVYETTQPITVFEENEGGYFCLKIPSLVRCQSGTVLAFAEARVGSCSDFAWTDLVVKRSTDAGATWSDLQLVRSEGSRSVRTVVGNAVPVAINRTGRILLPHTVNNSKIWMMHSDDDGVTWSSPFMLKGVSDPSWHWVGTGPPGSLELSSGRVIVPAYHGLFRSNSGNLFTYLHTLYSDDEGETWNMGENRAIGETGLLMENENQAVELKNGSVLVLSRLGGMFWDVLASHVSSRSDDGGLTFSHTKEVKALRQPIDGCQGSLIRGHTGTLLYSSPAPKNLARFFRRRMTLFESRDEGTSWSERFVLHTGGSGYSSMANMGSSTGILYEQDDKDELIMKPSHIVFLPLTFDA